MEAQNHNSTLMEERKAQSLSRPGPPWSIASLQRYCYVRQGCMQMHQNSSWNPNQVRWKLKCNSELKFKLQFNFFGIWASRYNLIGFNGSSLAKRSDTITFQQLTVYQYLYKLIFFTITYCRLHISLWICSSLPCHNQLISTLLILFWQQIPNIH